MSARFAAVLLAAGSSRRMGADNKLLMEFRGAPLAAHALAALQASKVQEIVVVLGHEAADVRAALAPQAGPSVRFLTNPAYRTGLAGSLVCGLQHLGGDRQGTVIGLGDMPLVTASVVNALLAALEPGDYAAVPVRQAQWGNPVVLSREAARDALVLTGDRGARALLRRHVARVREVPAPSDAVLIDIDRQDDLAFS